VLVVAFVVVGLAPDGEGAIKLFRLVCDEILTSSPGMTASGPAWPRELPFHTSSSARDRIADPRDARHWQSDRSSGR
jgi:hypothetical protein